MDWFYSLKLIRLFDFYLAVAFLLSTVLRIQQYRTILQVVRRVPGRWPRLFELVKQYRHLFLTWGTIGPLVLTLGLWLTNTILRRLILAGSEDLTVREVMQLWPAIPAVAGLGLAMLLYDIWGIVQVEQIDRPELEKYFDQAEYWLRWWTAPVVKFFTFGYVNPRQMVDTEVRNALTSASQMLNSSFRWLALQAGLRVAFGLSLWVSFASLQ